MTKMMFEYPNRSIQLSKKNGFTLVEVLVALVITGICAAVVLGKTTEVSAHYNMLEERTYSSWIAQNEIARYRLSKEDLHVGGNSNTVDMGYRRWQVDSQVTETDLSNLYKVLVEVSPETTNSPAGKGFSMTGFLSKAPE